MTAITNGFSISSISTLVASALESAGSKWRYITATRARQAFTSLAFFMGLGFIMLFQVVKQLYTQQDTLFKKIAENTKENKVVKEMLAGIEKKQEILVKMLENQKQMTKNLSVLMTTNPGANAVVKTMVVGIAAKQNQLADENSKANAAVEAKVAEMATRQDQLAEILIKQQAVTKHLHAWIESHRKQLMGLAGSEKYINKKLLELQIEFCDLQEGLDEKISTAIKVFVNKTVMFEVLTKPQAKKTLPIEGSSGLDVELDGMLTPIGKKLQFDVDDTTLPSTPTSTRLSPLSITTT